MRMVLLWFVFMLDYQLFGDFRVIYSQVAFPMPAKYNYDEYGLKHL